MGFKLKNTRSLALDYDGEDLRIEHRVASLKQTLSLEALQVGLGAVAALPDDASKDEKDSAKHAQNESLHEIVRFISAYVVSIKGRDDDDPETWVDAELDDDGRTWRDFDKDDREDFALENFNLMTALTNAIVPKVNAGTKKKSETA